MDTPRIQPLTEHLADVVSDLIVLAEADPSFAALVDGGRTLGTQIQDRLPPPSECCGNPSRCFAACGDLRQLGHVRQ